MVYTRHEPYRRGSERQGLMMAPRLLPTMYTELVSAQGFEPWTY